MSELKSPLVARLREAAQRWMPGVDFGPDLLREAADAFDERDTGLWSGADPRIVTLRRERDEARLRDQIAQESSASARRLRLALESFDRYWRDYDFADSEDMKGLRDTLQDLAFEAHSAWMELMLP